jgi:hypothetical protein
LRPDLDRKEDGVKFFDQPPDPLRDVTTRFDAVLRHVRGAVRAQWASIEEPGIRAPLRRFADSDVARSVQARAIAEPLIIVTAVAADELVGLIGAESSADRERIADLAAVLATFISGSKPTVASIAEALSCHAEQAELTIQRVRSAVYPASTRARGFNARLSEIYTSFLTSEPDLQTQRRQQMNFFLSFADLFEDLLGLPPLAYQGPSKALERARLTGKPAGEVYDYAAKVLHSLIGASKAFRGEVIARLQQS